MFEKIPETVKTVSRTLYVRPPTGNTTIFWGRKCLSNVNPS